MRMLAIDTRILMPDGLALAFETPGLIGLMIAAVLAGLVYGFAGFGAALVFMPLASATVGPMIAVPAFQFTAIISLLTVVPRAAPVAQWRPVAVLLLASLIAAPVGIWMLANWPAKQMRWGAVTIIAVTLAALVLGWRYKATPGVPTQCLVGAGAGIMGASMGLNGPLVILFQLGGQNRAEQVRANMVLFLTFNSLLLLLLMTWQGVLTSQAFWLGAVMLLPYGLATVIGQAFFDPNQERLYRVVAYILIALSVLVGLPLWD